MEKEILQELKTEILAYKLYKKGRKFTHEDAVRIHKDLNLDETKYNIEEFHMGLNVELEHGLKGNWNVSNNDEIITAKIALAHLDELPDYYTRLAKMEEEGKRALKKE